ncbi:hypothetical protein Lal_00023810 [Lupinus albus]|nr:hypothetical protein Lal_00023810 [Lupinus albus]
MTDIVVIGGNEEEILRLEEIEEETFKVTRNRFPTLTKVRDKVNMSDKKEDGEKERILNLECAILPSGSNNEAIPLEATVSTICFSDLNAYVRVLHIWVFPVPP